MSDELNEIWELYADEGQQSLQAAEEAVLFLKKSPSDKETISSLFRSVHTFKGNSRVMGLSVIESRAHVAEDLIGMVRDEGVPIDDEIIDLLLEMIDVLNDMLATTCETQNDAEPENSAELVDRLKQKIARCHSVESPKVDEPVLTEEELVEIDDDFFASAKKPDTEIEAEIDEVENQVEEVVEQETNGASYVLESEIPHDDDMHELFENASFVTESAMIFNPVDLASDPVYREMFATMARETLLEMQQSLTKFDANPEAAQSELHEQAEHIDFAAQQLNFFEWENLLVDFLSSSTFQKSDAENLFANLKALLQQDFGIELPDPNDPSCFDGNDISYYNAQNSNENQAIVDFFNEIKKPLGLVKAVYDASEFDSTQFINALDEIKTLASPLHFVQLETLIDDFVTPNRDATLTHQNVQDFLFWLFEALVAIEDAALEGQQPNVISHTKTLLGYFCSKHVFENLLLIESILEHIKNKSNIEESCLCINEALRKIYYACQHYGLETAAQLSTSLIDLFARVTNGDMVVDGFMLHIARSFVSDIELVLNSLESGISPDMGQIEKLLDDATSAAFVSSGAIVSASMIEARLGLPQSFHKILTTDSVKMAVEALDAHHNFYIVRTDLEQDEELATNFLTWVSSGTVTTISNVTVFEGNRTLFDFLIATPLNLTQLNEVLIRIDPSGKALFVTHPLEDHKVVGDETNRLRQNENVTHDSDGLPPINQGQMSGDMLESIGELVTNQAMMRHLLRDLVEEDLAKNIEAKLNAVDGNWTQAKDDVRQYLLLWQDKVEKLIQIEVQTNALMEQLQEGAIAGRMRSATQLLKPLYPFVESTARQKNRQVNFSTEGDEVSLDFTMLENLKTPLRTLLTFCMTQSIEPKEQRITKGKNDNALLRVILIENDDHVKIIIEDDGIGIDMQNLGRRTVQLGLPNQLESIFHSAYGITYNDDDSENGVDFSKMRDTLQLHGGNIWVTNLPTGGLRFTLTMSLTMLLLEGMVVRINSVYYVIPIDAIQRIIRIDRDNLMRVSADDGGHMLHLEHNETVPVRFLKGNHQETGENNDNFGDDEKQLFVVIGKESQRVAIKVSELIGQQNVLSRPLQGYLSHIRGVIGCTLLGSSDVGLVLDINAVFDSNNQW